ncbi:MAG: DUF2807 domain-containing protein [Bacteroidales bacterium]|nr:DUF2807 domain-containing protein [Bacteroidales bacterium]MCF6341416.1 DUF2807 domain-containing protein [Bacteroidales bacterium]
MKPNSIILAVAMGFVLLWSSACRKPFAINGNKQVETETRQMVSFENIVNEGPFNVYIMHDSIYQVVVEAESNLIPYIRTRVNGNTLIIETRENMNSHWPMNVYVKSPIVKGVYLKGSGYMNLDSLNSNHLQVEISGSGDITGMVNTNTVNAFISGSGTIFLEAHTTGIVTKISGTGTLDLSGESENGTHTISGSGNINAYNFPQKECYAKISGSGNMYLNVSHYLDVAISGSGSVFYIGDPQLSVKITGSGSVIKQ